MLRTHALGMLLLSAAVTTMNATVAETTTPDPETVRKFYVAYQQQHFSGLPDAKQLAALSGHFSSGLKALMRKAQSEQSRCNKAHPDEKGPWIEGDMFSSNFEGFTSVLVVEPVLAAAAGGQQPQQHSLKLFRVAFEYVENGQKVTWKDDVVMRQEAGRWVIDDILYKSGQNFSNGFGSGLRQSLTGRGCE
jgi:hypothetical protein